MYEVRGGLQSGSSRHAYRTKYTILAQSFMLSAKGITLRMNFSEILSRQMTDARGQHCGMCECWNGQHAAKQWSATYCGNKMYSPAPLGCEDVGQAVATHVGVERAHGHRLLQHGRLRVRWRGLEIYEQRCMHVYMYCHASVGCTIW